MFTYEDNKGQKQKADAISIGLLLFGNCESVLQHGPAAATFDGASLAAVVAPASIAAFAPVDPVTTTAAAITAAITAAIAALASLTLIVLT